MNPPIPKAAPRQRPPTTAVPGRDRRSQEKLRSLINKILSAQSITRTLFESINEFRDLFDADKITIYAIDRPKSRECRKVLRCSDLRLFVELAVGNLKVFDTSAKKQDFGKGQ